MNVLEYQQDTEFSSNEISSCVQPFLVLSTILILWDRRIKFLLKIDTKNEECYEKYKILRESPHNHKNSTTSCEIEFGAVQDCANRAGLEKC